MPLDDLDDLGTTTAPLSRSEKRRRERKQGRRKSPSTAAYPPLPEAEQREEVSAALGLGQGGLQLLGSALDTLNAPGAYIRGALGGKPGEKAEGRALLESYGLIGPNTDQGWIPDAGDLAGFAVDVATDPLTYLTLGASAGGKALKVAKKVGLPTKGAARYGTLREGLKDAGRLTDTGQSFRTLKDLRETARAAKGSGVRLKDVLDDQMGGLFGITSGPLGLLGIGGTHVPQIAKSKGARAVTEGLGAALALPGKIPLPGGNTLGRTFDALTDWTTQGFAGEYTQPLAKAQTEAIQTMKPAMRHAWSELLQPMKDVRDAFAQNYGQHLGGQELDELTQRLTRLVAEGKDPDAAMDFLNQSPMLQSHLGNVSLPQGVGDKLKGLVGPWKQWADREFQEALDMGIDSALMLEGDATQHSARSASREAAKLQRQHGSRQFGTQFDSMKGRLPATSLLPADAIDAIYQDAEIAKAVKAVKSAPWATQGANPPLARLQTVLRQKYGQFIDDAGQTLNQTANPYLGLTNGTQEVLEGLANHLIADAKAVEQLSRRGGNKYATNWAATQLKYGTDVVRAKGNARAIHATLSENLVPANAPGAVPLADVFKAANLNPDNAANWFAKQYGADAAQQWVPREIADAVATVSYRSTDDEWLRSMKEIYDTGLNLWKKHVTLPFPSFWTRNLASGLSMPVLFGDIKSPGDSHRFMKELAFVDQVASNPEKYRDKIREWIAYEVISPGFGAHDVEALQNLSPDALQGSLFSPGSWWKSLKKAGSQAKASATAPRMMQEIPGVGGVLDKTVGRAWGGVKGVSTGTTDFGARVSAMVEVMNRAPHYEFLRKQGWSPVEAAKRVKMMQVDYSQLTPAEKEFGKRIVPFFTYMRKTVPAMLGDLAQRPGGGIAQAIRVADLGRDQGEYVPGYVGEGMAIPLGKEGRYLSQIGLPTDQFGELAATGPSAYGTARRTLQKLGSQMAPPLKALIEVGTGTNLFTGKPLTELYQYPTNNILANQLLGNSPAAAAISKTRSITDPRKGLSTKAINALTGARITDVSGGLERQQQYAAKEILDEILREQEGIGVFTNVYAKKDAKLKPRTQRLLRVREKIMADQRKAEKERKKKAAAG